MNLFKYAYQEFQSVNQEIYKAFGFKHLSDASQYYVHPDNQSETKTTRLAKPIGEAITMTAQILLMLMNPGKEEPGNLFFKESDESLRLHLIVPQEWKTNGIIPERVYEYRAEYDGRNQIFVGAYNQSGKFLFMKEHLDYYMELPEFIVLLAYEIYLNDDLSKMMFDFIEHPAADLFVNIHEDFYQKYKNEDFEIIYQFLEPDPGKEYQNLKESFRVIAKNREELENNGTAMTDTFSAETFSHEERKFIPKLGREFQMPQSLVGVADAVVHGDTIAVLFHGPSGTGKTMNCKLICREIGLPVKDTINCTENLDEFVLGKYIPVEDRIVFKESPVTDAIRNGGAVVFEEINFAKPQYLAFLNSLLDDNGFVRLDDGTLIHRHKNFRLFATMNFGYFGTRELNQALYNRFPTIIEVPSLPDEFVVRMLKGRVPECEPVIDKMIQVYHKIQRKIKAEELDVVLSPRNLESWARLARYEGYVKAAEKTLVPVAKCDRVLEDTIRSMVMLYQW